MTDHLEVPTAIVDRVRLACSHLPEAYEERAYAGVRWRVRGRTLAHVMTVLREAGTVTHVTFHAAGEELDALPAMGHPYYPGWGAGLLAMVLYEDSSTDWDEVRELLTDSYRLLAPKKLVVRLDAAP